MEKKVSYRDVLSHIVKIWIVCYGALTLQVVAGYWASHVIMPYIGFVLIGCIVAYANYNLRTTSMNCSMMTHFTVYTLFASGMVMLLANFLNMNFITIRFAEFSYQEHPFQAAFIVYPLATLFYGIALLRRGNPAYCGACRTMAGFSVKESLRRNVLHHEGKFQLRLAFYMSLAITAIQYFYYFSYYSKDYATARYSPDTFFIYILPATLYIIAVVYIGLRYATLDFEISLKMSQEAGNHTSRLRYMVVWRDQLLLKDILIDGANAGYWDTPAEKVMPYNESMSEHLAKTTFRSLSEMEEFSVRKLFVSGEKEQNVFHYAAFIDDEAKTVNDMGGTWFHLREVNLMLKNGNIARPFAMELYRVFTITMAWKTYDRDGKRLYPIKNYRPSFRLRDFHSWDVDYEDMHWMSVAQNNQDKPFYQMRKLWRRYINGIDNRWDKKGS